MVVLAVFAGAAPAAKKKPSGGIIVRYVGARRGAVLGRQFMILRVAPPLQQRRAAEIIVPNNNPTGKAYDPDAHMARIIKTLKRGDLIRVRTVTWDRTRQMLSTLAVYTLQPGDEDPDCFRYVQLTKKTSGLRTDVGVSLEKFGVNKVVMIPASKGADGKWTPDAALLAKAKPFKAGDLVKITTERTRLGVVLKDIVKYTPVRTGRFVKIEPQQAGAVKFVVVVIRCADRQRRLRVPNRRNVKGKSVPDPALLAAVKELAPNQAVTFEARRERQIDYLDAIAPAKAPMPDTQPAKEPDKADEDPKAADVTGDRTG